MMATVFINHYLVTGHNSIAVNCKTYSLTSSNNYLNTYDIVRKNLKYIDRKLKFILKFFCRMLAT